MTWQLTRSGAGKRKRLATTSCDKSDWRWQVAIDIGSNDICIFVIAFTGPEVCLIFYCLYFTDSTTVLFIVLRQSYNYINVRYRQARIKVDVGPAHHRTVGPPTLSIARHASQCQILFRFVFTARRHADHAILLIYHFCRSICPPSARTVPKWLC